MMVLTMKLTHLKWSFKIAGSMAFKEAMKKADPVLLEPLMKVTVIVPEEYMGDVIVRRNTNLNMTVLTFTT